MELKSSFKRTQLGLIPEDWESTTVNAIASPAKNAIVGGPFGSDLVSKDYVDDGVPVIRGQNMGGKWIGGEFAFVSNSKAASLQANLAQPGDIVFTQRGTLGQVSLVPDFPYQRYLISQSQMKLSVDRGLADPLFLYYLFTGEQEQEYVRQSAIQTGVPHTNLGILRNTPAVLPPLVEQNTIATALSDVDALLSKLDQFIAKKRDAKQGAMHDLLTGTKRLAGFTGKWPAKTLGELFTFSGGYTASRDQLSSDGLCYLHYGDIHTSSRTVVDTHADFASIPKLNIPLREVPSKSLLDDGDVVFVDASEDDEGTSKHVVVANKHKVPFISGLHTIVAKSRTDELIHEYRRYCFQALAIKRQFLFYAVGTKVSGINKTNIAKLILPVPAAPEQAAIATMLSDIDAEIAALEARRDKTRLLKQGMMQELLTGRIRLV